MTDKQVTAQLYFNIHDAGRIGVVNHNDRNYYIFKSSLEEKYMVCELESSSSNTCSGVLTSLSECNNWIESQ